MSFDKKIILLFGILPESHYEEIIRKSNGVLQFAADALQKSIIEGLSFLVEDARLINLPYIGSYPFMYPSLITEEFKFDYKAKNGNVVRAINCSFFNFKGLKLLSRYFVAKNHIMKSLDATKENVIIVYALHTPFIKAAIEVKKRKPSTKIIVIVPDLVEYMSENESFIRKLFNNMNIKYLYSLLADVNSYVLLTEGMKDRLPMKNKKYTIIEGVFNELDDIGIVSKNQQLKTIFYAGTLAKRYGIMNLVNAFLQLNNDNYQLVICGGGDSYEEISLKAKSDQRIILLGQLKREKILVLQKQSSLLVNPRTPDGEYTKYSFPSKTMEYLESGTPTLLYKLPGIPDEYYKYCFTINKNGVEALSKEIDRILHLDESILTNMGNEARKFILERKNPYVQCSKILKLL